MAISIFIMLRWNVFSLFHLCCSSELRSVFKFCDDELTYGCNIEESGCSLSFNYESSRISFKSSLIVFGAFTRSKLEKLFFFHAICHNGGLTCVHCSKKSRKHSSSTPQLRLWRVRVHKQSHLTKKNLLSAVVAQLLLHFSQSQHCSNFFHQNLANLFKKTLLSASDRSLLQYFLQLRVYLPFCTYIRCGALPNDF